ncbi:MAG: LacI family transcriptional regulator [Lachnospiraceae bacterium]|nr:LacI family transcriptional regulator [Lachnospiraceae bacterium]
MVTIQDVAKAAKVSIGTVSRALNDYTDISEETRARVQKVAKELGYFPNLNARSLSSKRQINIALILSGFLEEKIFNDYETMLMKGCYRYALEHGIEISMRVINTRIQEEKTYDQLCSEYGISGAVFFGLKTTDFYCEILPKSEHPSVTVDMELLGARIGNVMVDNFQAFRELTQHLVDCGHRRIVLMHGRKNTYVSQERLAGAREALKANGLELTADQIVYTNFLEEEAYENTLVYFKNHAPGDVTAFLCMSDLIAVGTINALKHLGYRVPEDYSVVGYDGLNFSAYTDPKLTTVDQNAQNSGYVAAELLHHMIKGEAVERRKMMPYRIVYRDSVQRI